jgi:DNA-binding CsgD family transcriptional regulator
MPFVVPPGGLMPSDRDGGGLPGGTAEILTEVAGIADGPGSLAERAEALLAQLQRVVRFDAGWITLLPADQDAHVAVARSGYDERICGHLDSASVLEEVELVGLSRSRRPLRGRDLPFPPSEVPTWAEYLEPAGFRDGVSTGLFTPEGRYLGLLALHTRAADQVSDAARDLLEVLAAHIADAVDPLRSLATIAQVVGRAAAGIVLAPSGAVLPLPGLPGHRLLAPGSAVLIAAALRLTRGGPLASFLAALPGPTGREGAETHVRVTVLAVPPDVRLFAAAVVLVSPAGNLRGLTPRELEVLGLLIEGYSNGEIAHALVVAQRTVAAHLEHILVKLSAPSRTLAAVRAERSGLYVPFPGYPGMSRGSRP